MAARALSHLHRINLGPLLSEHCGLPVLGRLGVAASDPRRRGEQRDGDYDYARARALVAQTRDIHVTPRNESTVLIAGLGVAASALAAQYGLQSYRAWQASQPKPEAQEKPPDGEAGEKATAGATSSSFFGAFEKRHYEGGFEDKMTRKEAALILGVRESATPQRIKDAHRRILMINHPDKGGSKFMAAKINEAKEMLLKGRI